MTTILAFAGSTRSDSYNKKLIRIAAEGARAAGAEVTLIDLRDFSLPLYDGDLELSSGIPAKALELKELFAKHQGLLIATPEYNGSLPGVLKNAIDWVSRSAPGEKALQSFRGKSAGLISASPSRVGGMRALMHLRHVLLTIGVVVMPDHRTLAIANQAFAEDGNLKDAAETEGFKKVGAKLVDLTARLSG